MQVKNKIISGIKKVNPYIRTFQKIQKEVNISAHASSAAFFLFLSIIPVIIIVCALLQHAPTVQIEIWSYLSEAVIPKTISDFLMDIVNTYQGNSMTLVSVSAIITAWSASKGMLALMRGMNAVYELQESRNYIMLRLRALVYLLEEWEKFAPSENRWAKGWKNGRGKKDSSWNATSGPIPASVD